MTDVILYEVSPRDGLQNEKDFVDTDIKVELINKLSETGLKKIEATSFVSPKWVPQLADNIDVMQSINRNDSVSYSALTPNLKGLYAAIDADVREVAVFAAASESFSQKNINCSISESIERFEPLMKVAKENNIAVRGYISCITHCPYDGAVDPKQVVKVSKSLLDMGCYEISLGDTTGQATAKEIKDLLLVLRDSNPIENFALHCHDTYGQAIANILTGLELGIRTIDSSVAALGGCPYAKGASGNVATEDVLYLLNGLGLNTGVDLDKIIDAAWFISNKLGRVPNSKISLIKRCS